MKKTIVNISKMDCPSEIALIERAFENFDSSIRITFDLEQRLATFYHEVVDNDILIVLKNAALPGILHETISVDEKDIPKTSHAVEAKTLRYLLGINFTMFIVEILYGFYADSTGLLADGLDMFSDSLVYALSLYAVGRSFSIKNKASFLSGIAQVLLGILCFLEAVRRFYYGSDPLSNYIIIISLFAFIANLLCLVLIHKHKDGEVHMRASWIFSANDVVINLGVILSGVLVYFMNTNIPDLVIGLIISSIITKGGITIIKMSKVKNKCQKRSKII